jgi:Chalcone isomerase-like
MRTRSGEPPTRRLLAVVAMLAPLSAWAGNLPASPVLPTLPSEASVGGEAVPLRGAGVSTKYTVEVCQVALYAPARLAEAQDIARGAGPRRLLFHMLRDVSGDDFREGLLDMSRDKVKAPARTRHNLRLLVEALGERMGRLSRGDIVAIDWVPGAGVTITRNTQPLVPALPDPDLFQLLAELWIGADSADADLRRRLLGQPHTTARFGAVSFNR